MRILGATTPNDAALPVPCMDLGTRARTLNGACLAHPEWIEMILPRYLLKVVWPSTTLPAKQSGVNGPSSAGPMRTLTGRGQERRDRGGQHHEHCEQEGAVHPLAIPSRIFRGG